MVSRTRARAMCRILRSAKENWTPVPSRSPSGALLPDGAGSTSLEIKRQVAIGGTHYHLAYDPRTSCSSPRPTTAVEFASSMLAAWRLERRFRVTLGHGRSWSTSSACREQHLQR